ncbi:MAG: amidohydrolase family protein [Microthrixaceae bacterium]
MPSRQLDFPVFDADNHMYETEHALTRYLPAEYEGIVKYVEVNGRTKIAVNGRISDYIPNPTFSKVAAPGIQEEYFRDGNKEGKSRREILGKAIDATPAMRAPEPRLKLMNEQGIDRAIMWPTLASLVEERLRDDPDAIHAIVHSLNQWMHEEWTFNYEDRIFATPVITLPVLEKALAELDWLLERGARIILIRPAPVPGWKGPRSFALPEFDPFWKRVEEAGLIVGMHASDSGYTRYTNEWEGIRDGEFFPFRTPSAFQMIVGGMHREITDTVASAIGHGLLSRFPKLKLMPVENGSGWVRPLIRDMEFAYETNPHLFDEDPVMVLKRNVVVHPFHEENTQGLIDVIGVDNVVFGSDYPHPEGLADPISFIDELDGLPEDQIAKVMGGNLGRLMDAA